MKIFIIGLSLFLIACSPSLIIEKPNIALEYAHSLIDLKVQILALKKELEQAESNDKEQVSYELHILPKMITNNQEEFLKSQKVYLAKYAEYESKIDAIEKSNKEQKLAIQSYNKLAIAEYNNAIAKEEFRVIALNKSLKSTYDEKIIKELPKQNRRTKEMKVNERGLKLIS